MKASVNERRCPVEEEITPHRKRSQRKSPKKTDHKHDYQPCVFEYDSLEFDKAHGLVPGKIKTGFGMYCTICGKIGGDGLARWTRWVTVNGGPAGHSEYTEEAEAELNPETRTLPTFRINDMWMQRFVDLNTTSEVAE